MIRLERSSELKRIIRRDDIADLGIPSLEAAKEAIKAGKPDKALALIDYELEAGKRTISSLTLFRQMALVRLAEGLGEAEIERIYRERYTSFVQDWIQTTPGPRESLERFAEAFRGLRSGITIAEEPDRFIFKLDPCGSGGVLRRTTDARGTAQAYPWSWSRKGVCYYCAHCCLLQEILPIEMRGYPICVTEYPGNPGDACVHLYYKRPELIPSEYFTRVGAKPRRQTAP